MDTDTQQSRRTTDITFGLAIVILALVLIGVIGVEGGTYLPWTKAEAISPDEMRMTTPSLVSATTTATTTPAP